MLNRIKDFFSLKEHPCFIGREVTAGVLLLKELPEDAGVVLAGGL